MFRLDGTLLLSWLPVKPVSPRFKALLAGLIGETLLLPGVNIGKVPVPCLKSNVVSGDILPSGFVF